MNAMELLAGASSLPDTTQAPGFGRRVIPPPPPAAATPEPAPESANPMLETPKPTQDPETTHFINVVTESIQKSDNDRINHKNRWDVCWDLFNNNYDFSGKEEWQSKNWIPKLPTLVRATVSIIKEALLSGEEIGTIEGHGELSRAKAPMMKKLVLYAVDKSKFVDKLCEAIMAGMLTPGVNLKIYPASETVNTSEGGQGGPANLNMRSKKTMVVVESISEYFLRRDPTGRNKHKIHTFEMDLEDLKELAQDPNNGYDKDVVDSIKEDGSRKEGEFAKAKRDNQPQGASSTSYRKSVKIDEFWGQIHGADGKILYRMGTMSVANDKYLIRRPMPSPFRKANGQLRDPFVSAFLCKVPFSTWHEAFVYGISGIALMITELMNLALDGNKYDSIRSFQIDIDKIEDPADVAGGVWPGMAVKTTNTNGQQAIRALELGKMSNSQQIIYEVMTSELQNGAGSNEFAIPQLGGGAQRGDPTATEVNQKGQQAQVFSNDLARTIELEAIEPALDIIKDIIIQFFDDFSSDEMVDLLGRDAYIMQMAKTDDERRALLGGNYYTKSRAITGIVKKFQTLEKLKSLREDIQAFPEALGPLINVVGLFTYKLELLQLDQSRVMNPIDPQPQMPVENPMTRNALMDQLAQIRVRQGMQHPIDAAVQGNMPKGKIAEASTPMEALAT